MYEDVSMLQSFFYLSGYFTLITCGLLLARYLARKSKNPLLIKKFHNIHKPLGHIALVFAIIHGAIALLCMPSQAIANVSGIASCLLIVALLLNYQTRTKKHGNWFRKHQTLALTFLPIILFHLATSAYADIVA